MAESCTLDGWNMLKPYKKMAFPQPTGVPWPSQDPTSNKEQKEKDVGDQDLPTLNVVKPFIKNWHGLSGWGDMSQMHIESCIGYRYTFLVQKNTPYCRKKVGKQFKTYKHV